MILILTPPPPPLRMPQEFAESIGLSFLETSAKQASKEGKVEEAFMTIAAQIKERCVVKRNVGRARRGGKLEGERK